MPVSEDLRYKDFIVERPMVGYGLTPPDVQWGPTKKAKIAVSFVVEYTEGGEMSVEYGDINSECLFSDLAALGTRETRDDMMESEWEYGPRAGMPKLMRLFEKHQIKATVNVVTSALEKAPYWGTKLSESNHEISCAGSRWMDYLHVAPEVEEQQISDAIESLQALTGSKTRLYARANKERGIPLLYSSDSFGDDLPYWVVSPLSEEGGEDEGLLILPTSLDCSDFRFNASGQGWSSGEDYYSHLVDTFETLYAEGEIGEAKMMTVTVHPRIIGRSGRLAYLEKFMAYVKSKADAWIARRDEIAVCFRQQFPYEAAAAHGQLPIDADSAKVASLSPVGGQKVSDWTSTANFKERIPKRDFVAYGMETPKTCWPNASTIAVSFVLNFEEGAEHTLWNGDRHSEAFLTESAFHRQPVNGRRDLYTESQFEYGTRSGLPRLLKLFKKYCMSWTTWTCARALEASPYYASKLVEGGHEIACHGNRWITQTELSGPAEEYQHICQAIDRLRNLTGLDNVPTGWYLGRGSLFSKFLISKAHKEKRVPLLYSSDTYADDLPYYVENPLEGDVDEGLLMVPYSLCNNDHRFYCKGAGASSGDDFFHLLKADFDGLRAEGLAGHPKMMTIAMHSRILGRPGRIASLERFMKYVSGFPDAWVTTREQIATHWRKEFPYVAPTRERNA